MNQRDREDIIQALRGGLVPRRGLHYLATGLESLVRAVELDLDFVASGRCTAKWIRGEYGSGKTFATRLLCARARERGFATAEVQISITDTPLHHLETVYRRLIERLETSTEGTGAFQAIVDGWLYKIGDEAQHIDRLDEDDPRLAEATEQRLEDRLRALVQDNRTFPAVLRAYHRAMFEGDFATAQGLIAWLSGQPQVSSSITRKAGIKGGIDGAAAVNFIGGLLGMLRQTGRPGLMVVLDEVETIQRMNAQTREKSLVALRQLTDALAAEQLPGLYLVITGTRDFYEGYKGLKGSTPLYQRVNAVKFDADPQFPNWRATQVHLAPFEAERLLEVGRRVRDIYPAHEPDRVNERVSDTFLRGLVDKVTSGFGGRVPVVPRLFLRELVDIIDRVEQHPAYDPAIHYKLDIEASLLSPEELAAKEGCEVVAVEDEAVEPVAPRRLDG